MFKSLPLVALLGVLLGATPVRAQQPPAQASANPTTVCGLPIPVPAAVPPANSGPVIFQIVPCFEAQGNLPLVDPATYLYYIQLQSSRPSQGIWVPWTEESERTVIDDHRRLWATNFLDDLSIEALDYTFSNGVIGKMIVYRMEERQRVKIVDFVGSKKIETSDIDTKLREADAQIRLDTFIDASLIRKVEGIVREMLKAKGFQVLERDAHHRGALDRSEAGAPDVQPRRGAQGQDQTDRLRRKQGGQRRHPEGAAEGEQGAVVPLVRQRPRDVSGGEVRGRRRSRARGTTAITAM